MRLADYVAQLLSENGINHVFMVTGGGAMHLNDAFGRNKDLKYICCHHEQACAMAADSYFRMTNQLAAVNVTTGPGCTNAITGVYGAYVDSMGMVVISGQVKWQTLVRSYDLPLRQLGDQEVDIVKMVEGITKYAVIIKDPKSIRYHIEKAIYLAKSGRPGPVWVDIPIDVQATRINPEELKAFDPKELATSLPSSNLDKQIDILLEKLSQSLRPVIMTGAGVRLSNSYDLFLKVIEKLGVPVVTNWNAHDVLWNDHPLYVGRPGSIGDRPGNFAVQNSDFVLVLGSRLNIRQISYNWETFARGAYKVMVDIDAAELQKPTIKIDLPICANLKDFFSKIIEKKYSCQSVDHKNYLTWCKERLKKYPVVLDEYWNNLETVNPYCFVDQLYKELNENELVVTGDGTACVVTFQAAQLKQGQRLYTNSGCASMGFDLPAAIGAYLATDKPITCIAGDGSIMMNLQELQTIVMHKMPIKIFIFYNKGYHSIRQTQHNFFKDNIVGCGEESGLSFPDFEKIAHAFGIPFRRCHNHSEMEKTIRATVRGDGPQICEVVLDMEQQFSPKLSSRKLDDGRMVTSPLEDMAPFLPREELKENMLIPLLGE